MRENVSCKSRFKGRFTVRGRTPRGTRRGRVGLASLVGISSLVEHLLSVFFELTAAIQVAYLLVCSSRSSVRGGILSWALLGPC